MVPQVAHLRTAAAINQLCRLAIRLTDDFGQDVWVMVRALLKHRLLGYLPLQHPPQLDSSRCCQPTALCTWIGLHNSTLEDPP